MLLTTETLVVEKPAEDEDDAAAPVTVTATATDLPCTTTGPWVISGSARARVVQRR